MRKGLSSSIRRSDEKLPWREQVRPPFPSSPDDGLLEPVPHLVPGGDVRHRLATRHVPARPVGEHHLEVAAPVADDDDGGAASPGRVDRGSCPPRPPTDPDVRNSRIRLLGSWFRCESVDALDHTWLG
jgi:hypothetical protein